MIIERNVAMYTWQCVSSVVRLFTNGNGLQACLHVIPIVVQIIPERQI
jgi:hypothetical protein